MFCLIYLFLVSLNIQNTSYFCPWLSFASWFAATEKCCTQPKIHGMFDSLQGRAIRELLSQCNRTSLEFEQN